MKECSKCREVKPFEAFSKRSDTKSGFKSHCKACIKVHNQLNKEYESIRAKKYYKQNSEVIKSRVKTYYKANKESLKNYRNLYWKNRAKIDPTVKVIRNIRSKLSAIFRTMSWTKGSKLTEYLGCSKPELILHFESKFKTGMSWSNYGTWHIDHIIPLSSAKSPEEVYKLNHYTNLQPLWAAENLSKSNKVN